MSRVDGEGGAMTVQWRVIAKAPLTTIDTDWTSDPDKLRRDRADFVDDDADIIKSGKASVWIERREVTYSAPVVVGIEEVR